ncbi:unnamed protein product [Caretta caretta]
MVPGLCYDSRGLKHPGIQRLDSHKVIWWAVTKVGFTFSAYDIWVEAFPLRSKSASEVAKGMYKMIVRRGCPKRILTDLGLEFNNKFNLYICERLRIERSFTSPYHA